MQTKALVVIDIQNDITKGASVEEKQKKEKKMTVNKMRLL